MDYNLEHSITLLSGFPASLKALLLSLPEPWLTATEGDKSWTPVQIVEHLIHAEEADWLPRVRTILEHGEAQTFAPFNREGYAAPQRSVSELLDDFAHLRHQNLAQLTALNLTPEELTRRGRHPAFGPVTLAQLLATWTTHDLTHLHQLSRLLARQYEQAVGPWSAYLGVLHCNGHSA